MPRLRSRAVVAALGAGLVLPALATLPSQAVEGTQNLSLTDCEMVLDPFFTNQRISDNGTWSTSVTLKHPSPVPVGSGQTANLTLGAIPTSDLPQELENVDVSVFVLVEDGRGFEFTLTPRTTTVPVVTPGTPVDLGEQDVDDLTYADSDRYDLAVKDITIGFFGDTPDGRTYYEYSCDQVVRGAPLVSVGVFDPAAAAQVFLDVFQVTQGESVRFRGEDFPNTVGPVTPTVGGQPANALPVDDIGFFDGQLVVPEFAPPGQQEVRVTYLGETASTFVTVLAKKAQLVVTKAVKAGKKLAVSGSQFKPGEKVTLKLKKKGPAKKGTKKAFGSSVTADANGQISKAVKLKKAAKGTWKITAKGAESGRTAASGFKVS
jgi:hypothetical protein